MTDWQTKLDNYLFTGGDRSMEPFHVARPDDHDRVFAEMLCDELTCAMCDTGVGFHLHGDHGGSWTPYWHYDADETNLCEDCQEEVTAEV